LGARPQVDASPDEACFKWAKRPFLSAALNFFPFSLRFFT
jgi:hypothetical protein